MRTSILAVALLLTLNCFSQTCNSVDKIISIQGGYPTNISVSFGIQGEAFGISAGVKGVPKKVYKSEIYPAIETFNANPFLQGSVKLYGSGEDCLLRIYLVGYGGLGKIFGGGAKLGFIASNDLIIYIQPMYTEAGKEGNIGLSFRF